MTKLIFWTTLDSDTPTIVDFHKLNDDIFKIHFYPDSIKFGVILTKLQNINFVNHLSGLFSGLLFLNKHDVEMNEFMGFKIKVLKEDLRKKDD